MNPDELTEHEEALARVPTQPEEPAIVDGPRGPEWNPRHGTFTPTPNFDPMDGDDPRVTPARDNPCKPGI